MKTMTLMEYTGAASFAVFALFCLLAIPSALGQAKQSGGEPLAYTRVFGGVAGALMWSSVSLALLKSVRKDSGRGG